MYVNVPATPARNVLIQCTLQNVPEVNEYPLANAQRALAALSQICAISKSCQYPLGNLLEVC